ncbi:MAG: hypothetical protein HZB20_07180 [Chloroflexi bacterium]|nr:hypothetical protein [Chloroflexota bacterium]
MKAVGRLQGDISSIELQLRDYNRNNTAVFSIMTDGQKWRFYYSQTGGEFSKKCFKALDVLEDEIEELESSFQTFLSKDELNNGNAKRNAETYLQLSQKQRAIEDVLPQARRIVLEPPYPSLPQAVIELVAGAGLVVTEDEAAQFIRDFNLRKPPPEQISIKPAASVHRARATRPDIPVALAHVLDVCGEVFRNNRSYREACGIITERKNLSSKGTVPNACTRAIDLDTAGFLRLLEDKDRLIAYLIKHYPSYKAYIREALE